MTDPGLAAAKRRLGTILADETYGPRLARLTNAEARPILDLVYENKGREARKAILEADENRRLRNRVLAKVRPYVAKTPSERSEEHPEFTDGDLYDQHASLIWDLYHERA